MKRRRVRSRSYMLQLLERLRRRGWRVDVIPFRHGNPRD